METQGKGIRGSAEACIQTPGTRMVLCAAEYSSLLGELGTRERDPGSLPSGLSRHDYKGT